MGQEVKVIYTDDLEKSRGNRVELDPEAMRQETVSWGGRTVKIYLSEGSWKEIDAFLAPLIETGGEVKSGRGVPATQRPAVRQAVQRGRATVWARLRAWADEQGRTAEYETPSGSFYPRKPLRDDYTAATGEEVPV